MASNTAVIDVGAIEDPTPALAPAPAPAPAHRRARRRRGRSPAHADNVETFDEEAALTAALVRKASLFPFIARDIVHKLMMELGGETVDKNEEEDEDEDDSDYEDDGVDDGGSVSGESSDDSSSDEDEDDEGEDSSGAVDQAENEDAGPSEDGQVRVRDPLMERVDFLKASGALLDDEPSHIRLWCTNGPNALEPPLEHEYLIDLDGMVVHITEFSLDELKEVGEVWMQRKAQRVMQLAYARAAAQDSQRRARCKRDQEALSDRELYDHAPALRFAVHSLRHDIREGSMHFDDVTPDVVKARVADFYAFPEFCTVEQALVYHAEKDKDGGVMALPADPAATTGKRKRSPIGDASPSNSSSSAREAFDVSSATGVVGQPLRSALKRTLPEDTPQPPRKTVRYPSALAVEQDTGLIWPVVEDITKTFSRRDRGQYAALIERMPRHLFSFVAHRLESHLKRDGVDYRAPKRQRTDAEAVTDAEPSTSLFQMGLGLVAVAVALL